MYFRVYMLFVHQYSGSYQNASMPTLPEKRFTFNFDLTLKRLATKQAEEEFITLASLINRAVAEYLTARGIDVKSSEKR